MVKSRLLAAVAALALAGCGTWIDATGGKPRMYGGLRYDLETQAPHPAPWPMALDLPAAFALDTALLPATFIFAIPDLVMGTPDQKIDVNEP